MTTLNRVPALCAALIAAGVALIALGKAIAP